MNNIPESLLQSLESIEEGTSAVLLLRHAKRGEIICGDDGLEVDLTSEGFQQSQLLGKRIGQRLQWTRSSPILRAKRTVEQVIKGANLHQDAFSITEDSLLGDPGPFVMDREKGKEHFTNLGTHKLVRQMASGIIFDGIRSALEGTKVFLAHLKKLLNNTSGLGLMISHDAILIPMISVWTGETFQDTWLDSLDGVLIADIRKKGLILYRNHKEYGLK